MRTLVRNKRKIYLCKRIVTDGLITYATPAIVYDNYVPTNNDSDLIALGDNYPAYLRIKTDSSNINRYQAGDRCYINVAPPIPHDVLCKNADYEVDTRPSDTLNVVEIMLNRLSGK